MNAILSVPPEERKSYAEKCLQVLDRSPEARLCYTKDEVLLLEALADRPLPLRYSQDLDVQGMIHLMRRMDQEAARAVAHGILRLLKERPQARRSISGSDLAYLESLAGPERFSEIGPRHVSAPAVKGPSLPPQVTGKAPVEDDEEAKVAQYSLAAFYADLWNDYLDCGGDVTLEEREDAAAELDDCSVRFSGEDFYAAHGPLRYSASDWSKHEGEKGGLGWKHKKTGEVVYTDGNPGEGAVKRQADRAKKAHVRPEKLLTRLAHHAEAYPLSDADRASAARVHKTLAQHHGSKLLYRVEELAGDLEQAHKAAPDDKKPNFGKRLSKLHHVVKIHGGSELNGNVEDAPLQMSKGISDISGMQQEPVRQKIATAPSVKPVASPPRPGHNTAASADRMLRTGRHHDIDALNAAATHPSWSHPDFAKLNDPAAYIVEKEPVGDASNPTFNYHGNGFAGINQSYRAKFSNGLDTVYKPTKGERIGSNPSVPHHLGGREAASWEITHALGESSLHPTTTFRHFGGGGHGSVQLYEPGLVNTARLIPRTHDAHGRRLAKPYTGEPHAYGDSNRDIAVGAGLNVLLGQLDDHLNNMGVKKLPDGTWKLVKFDHGLTLPENHNELRSKFDGGLVKEASNRDLHVPKEAAEWEKKMPEIEEIMRRRGLPERAIDLIEYRARILAMAAKRGMTWPELRMELFSRLR